MQHATCGPFGWKTNGAHPKHTLMALDDTTLLSRPATAADTKANTLGHLTEDSEGLDPETQLNGEAGVFSTTTHQSTVYDGTLTAIASAPVTKGDQVGVGGTAGQLEPGAALIRGIAMNAAAVGEYFAYLPR